MPHEGMWVVFGLFLMFSNFNRADLYNKTCVTPTNIRWNICKNRVEDLYLVIVIGNACLLILQQDTLSVEWLLIFEDVVQYLLNMYHYDVCAL